MQFSNLELVSGLEEVTLLLSGVDVSVVNLARNFVLLRFRPTEGVSV